MTEDTELLRRYAEESAEPAFEELVQRHLDLVYSAALRRLAGDAHSAADVTQQVFTALARQAGALARGVVLPAWLYNTTRNTTVDFIRAEQRRRAREQEAHTMQQLTSDSSAADWDRLRPLLDAAMDELAAPDREAVVLRYFARRPFAEIGRGLRVSEDAARMRVDRALEKLRVLLARRGVASTAAALTLLLQGQAALAAPAGLAGTITSAALATSAGAVTSPALGLLHFMSTSKIATGVVALLVAVTIGSVGYETYARRERTERAAETRQQHDALLARLRALQLRHETTQVEVNRKQTALSAIYAAQAAEKQRVAAAAAAAREAEIAAGDSFMERHPEVKQAYIDERRATVAGWNTFLFRKLGLTPEQIARCADLMEDAVGSISAPGGKSIRFTSGFGGANAQDELRTLLGEEGYQMYRDSRSSGFDRDISLTNVMGLAADLFDTGTPLTANQGEELRQILLDETLPSGTVVGNYNWSAILRRAHGILSDAQLAALERYRAGDEFRQALNQARKQARAITGGNQTATPKE